VAVVFERVAGGEQKNGREQIPLEFQPGVDAMPICNASRHWPRDQRHRQDCPGGTADALVDGIDALGDGDQVFMRLLLVCHGEDYRVWCG
jgi:hypothetical protein